MVERGIFEITGRRIMNISEEARHGGDAPTLFTTQRVRIVAILWCLIWPILLIQHLMNQVKIGWTDGVDRPFGEDFINFWSGARLALTGHSASVYNITAFHDFQLSVAGHSIDLYHYSYPPTLLVITAPLALLPYPMAWALWQGLGWLAFATALYRFAGKYWLLVAFAWPAVLINAIGGQAGCWTAAIIGWGMIMLPKRPMIAGIILSLLAVKPQLAWLLPLALIVGREWRALAGLAIGAVAVFIIATLAFGMSIWPAYAQQAVLLKRVILEDGTGTWHRMISIFVLVRHLGVPVFWAYAAQAVASVGVAWIVLSAWHRRSAARAPFLVLGMLAGSIYVSDYDCVMLAFPAVYLWHHAKVADRVAVILAASLPMLAAVLALATQIAIGALMLWPLLLALRKTDWSMRRATDGAEEIASGHADPMAA